MKRRNIDEKIGPDCPIFNLNMTRLKLLQLYQGENLYKIGPNKFIGGGGVCGRGEKGGAFCSVCIFHNQKMHVYLINIEQLLYTVNCVLKRWKIKKKRPGMAHFLKKHTPKVVNDNILVLCFWTEKLLQSQLALPNLLAVPRVGSL